MEVLLLELHSRMERPPAMYRSTVDCRFWLSLSRHSLDGGYLGLGSPEADTETKIQMQVVYLESK